MARLARATNGKPHAKKRPMRRESASPSHRLSADDVELFRELVKGGLTREKLNHVLRAPLRSLLSRPIIHRYRADGLIHINPFDPDSLGTTSYDVRIGPYCYREQKEEEALEGIFSPFSERDVRQYWGEAQLARRCRDVFSRGPLPEGIGLDDFVIILEAHETILAHTIEFIGGRERISSEMRARSSIGRVGQTVCKCASYGNVNFTNRWTMEITSLLKRRKLVIPVGARVAQIVFYEVDPLQDELTYAQAGGKYQHSDVQEEIEANWKPEMMLPRLHLDREVSQFRRHIPPDLLRQLEQQ